MAKNRQTLEGGESGNHLRPLCIVESRSLDLNTSIAHEGLFPYLAPDMLTFAIAIRPNEQNSGEPSLLLDVLRNTFVVLVDSQPTSEATSQVCSRLQYNRGVAHQRVAQEDTSSSRGTAAQNQCLRGDQEHSS